MNAEAGPSRLPLREADPAGNGSRPRQASVATGWIRATQDLRAACADLAPGSVISVPDVSMLDTVAATPIMDPRLDCGIRPMPLPLIAKCDRIREDASSGRDCDPEHFDPRHPLTLDDICWILDRLLSCEAAWLASESLASASLHQTVYTCLYVQHVADLYHNRALDLQTGNIRSEAPDRMPDLVTRVLHPALLAVISSVALVWTELIRGNLIDGEDYIGDRSGLQLCEDMDPRTAIAALADAVRYLNEVAIGTEDAQVKAGARKVIARLRFRKTYLSCLISAAQMDTTSSLSFGQHPFAILDGMQGSVQECQQALRSLVEPAERFELNGSPSGPHGIHDPALRQAPSGSARSCFNPWISRQMVVAPGAGGGVPVLPPFQPIELPDATKTRAVFEQVLSGLQDFRALHLSRQLWRDWKAFLEGRAINRSMDAICPYIRSAWQSAVCSNNLIAHGLPLTQLAGSYLLEVGSIPLGMLSSPALLPPLGQGHADDVIVSLQQRIPGFLERLAGQLVAHLRGLAQNRARARRYFSHAYGDLLALTDEAQALCVDLEYLGFTAFQPAVLRAAVQLLALEVMQHTIFSGIELDLLQTGELSAAYWMGLRTVDETYAVLDELSALQGSSQAASGPATRSVQLSNEMLFMTSLFRLCEAFFLLYEPGDATIAAAPWRKKLTGNGVHNVGINGDISSDNGFARSAFLERYRWLRVMGRPESNEQLDQLWEAYQVECGQIRSMAIADRLGHASTLFGQAVECLEELVSKKLAPPHSHARFLPALIRDMSRLAMACESQRDIALTGPSPAAPRRRRQKSILPLDYSKPAGKAVRHPWFPVFDEGAAMT